VLIIYEDLQTEGQRCLEISEQDTDMETQSGVYIYIKNSVHKKFSVATSPRIQIQIRCTAVALNRSHHLIINNKRTLAQ
jgi:hypothetical protein